MSILETHTFPYDDRFLGLRWIKGSGLVGQYDLLDQLVVDISFDPNFDVKSVDKPGKSLIVGDPANHLVKIVDKTNQFNPRLLLATKSTELRDVKLFQQQQTTRLGPDGGIRGRLKLAIDQDAAWALVTASYLPQDSLQQEHFVAQADARGEFVIDLSGLRMPDDDSDPEFSITVEAISGLPPGETANPDLFVEYQISSDTSIANLNSNITVTLDNYGGVKQLGDLLIAPT
jgi:hypothetical protein